MNAKFVSRSPVDGTSLWDGKATSSEEINAIMAKSARASRHWRAISASDRIEMVRRYAKELEADRTGFSDLITREVGKLHWDAHAEVGAAIAKVELSILAFEQRRNEQRLADGPDASVERRIRYHPLGVTLVLGPFNFPLHLPGGQIIPALLAGNTVVFKPSDQATALGHRMMEAWERVGLPDGVLQMITGGVDAAVTAIDSPHVGGVFLTGSRAAGQSIHRQLAGRVDVLLALELGGNNPIVIHQDAPPRETASLVSFSSFVSSGQRCTCARRAIFVRGDSTQSQIDALVEITRNLRSGMPGDNPPPHLGPLISPSAAASLRRTYDELMQLGCEAVIPFEVDARAENLVRPAIVDGSKLDSEALCHLGEMEWFGPLLVIHRVDGFETALAAAANTPYGLAAALLGGSKDMFESFVQEVGAGVVNWNGPTTGAAGALPFGGLGDSGNHRPAGFFAIDFCGDPVASLERASPAPTDPWSVVK